MNTPFFQVPTLEFGHGIGARVQGIGLVLAIGEQKWAPGPYAHTIFVSSGQSTALSSLLSACFKMASDRVTWSNYVPSHILGTQSVNTTPFCAGTQALVPLRTAP